MRRHLILFFLALFLIVACKDRSARGVIDQEKMAQILCEIHIIDGSMAVHGGRDSLYKYGTNRYALAFKKYGIDSAILNKSLKYYTATPKDMIELYERIDTLLKIKSDSVSRIVAQLAQQEAKQREAKLNAERKRKADSLRRDSIKAAAAGPVKLNLNKRVN